MPTAPQLEWPQGQPLFEVQWRAVSEALAGNGVKASTDMAVTATANNLEVQVAAGTAYYTGTEHSLGAAETHTLTAGDATYDRWDTVYFDTATDSTGVTEGTPAAAPEPPDVSADEILLAVVYVPQNATDVPDSDVLDWRAQYSNRASITHYADSTGVYGLSTVDAALDELQEAAQATAYPFALADLAAPFSLASISDLDVAGTDLVDGATTLYNATSGIFPQGVLGGPPGSLSAYPLAPATDLAVNAYPFALADLAAPFSLASISDLDVAGTDLVDGATTLYSASAGWVPRGVLDDQKATSTVATATYTTQDEEVVFVDTATIAAASTISLATADAVDGNTIVVADIAGSASSYNITVDGEGGETISGAASKTISTDGGALVFTSDGTNWALGGGGAGGGYDLTTDFDHSGSISALGAGNQAVVGFCDLAVGETLKIEKAELLVPDGTPSSGNMTLELVTFDGAGGYTSQATLITGDGSTVFDDETGNPLASYQNGGTAAVTAGVLINNVGTAAEDAYGEAKGTVV